LTRRLLSGHDAVRRETSHSTTDAVTTKSNAAAIATT